VPNLPPYLIRNRLFSFLEDRLDRSLICLTSDGGYGKTTLIASFVKEKNIPAIWYQLSHQDRNLQTFLSYMKTAISRKISGEHVIYDIQSENTDEEIDKIIAILSTWPSRLIIVLDHYQSIDQCEDIEKVLTRMITYASPFVTFIITSRKRPNLQLVNLKLQNRLAELTTKDLAFTKEEIFRFFVDLHHVTLHEHEIDLIFNKTEGWVTSLQLLHDIIKDMNETDRSSFWVKFNGTPDINDYLGAEILASQSEEIRNFLYKTCLLTELNANVINSYLGMDHSAEILEHLLKNHLFIYQTSTGTIKFHNLFRSFLYKELSKRYNRAEIDDFHKKLSHIYEQKADFIHAFAHSVVGSHFLHAAKLMKIMKERLNRFQFLTLIDTLLENFSPDLSSVSISLFLFRCIPLDVIKDLVTPIEIHFKGIKETTSPVLLIRFQYQLATLYFYIGEIHQSERLCSDSLHESIKIKDEEMICKNLTLKSLIYWKTGRHKDAIHFARESLSYPGNYSNFHPHYLALWILSEIYLEQNNLRKAKSLIEETLKLSKLRYDCSVIYPYCSMGKYYRLKGQYQEAFAWIKKAEDTAVKFNLDYDLGIIYKEMALTFIETKQWEEAEIYLSRSYEHLSHNTFLTCIIKRLQIITWKQLGKHQLAIDTQSELENIYKEKNYYWFFQNQNSEKHSSITIEDHNTAALSIYVLGSFEIKYKGKSITIKRKSSLRLLQYFISHRESKLTKDRMINELFPEGSIHTVDNQFYVALSHLRRALEPHLKSGRDSRFIKQSGEHYSLSMDDIYLDLHEFTQLVQNKDASSALERVEQLKRAELLYRGDYFEEYPYVGFLELEREKYRTLYLQLLRELALYYWDQKDYQQGIHYFEKAIEKEPYEESLYMEYIQRLLEANLLLQAKKVSALCEKFIEKELGIPVRAKLRNFSKQPHSLMKFLTK
jgi:LuxR family maltose regulon positive regulatory protein